MDRFYPNYYSSTKSVYKPLNQLYLKRSTSVTESLHLQNNKINNPSESSNDKMTSFNTFGTSSFVVGKNFPEKVNTLPNYYDSTSLPRSMSLKPNYLYKTKTFPSTSHHQENINYTVTENNNDNMVADFENTLQKMSIRLKKFTANSESKENELKDLKSTIQFLKKQTIPNSISIESNESSPKIYATSSLTSLLNHSNSNEKHFENSIKKSSWFKASLGRAFRKKSSKEEDKSVSTNYITNKNTNGTLHTQQLLIESDNLAALKKELEEKDARLTDVQLDTLTRSHQLEQLGDLLTKMRYEMSSLKADNCRLQGLMNGNQSFQYTINNEVFIKQDQNNTSKSIHKIKDVNSRPKFDFLNSLVKEIEFSKPLMVYYVINTMNKLTQSEILSSSDVLNTIPIGQVGINSKSSWSDLENNIRRLFKEYVMVIDFFSSLGLSGESISRYSINTNASISLCNTGGMRPLTSPIAVCNNVSDSKVYFELKNHSNGNSIDDMVFEFLIPKPILLRYFSLLLEHKKIILSGPSGTGKSFLANKLALNLASRYNRDTVTSIVTFNLDHKSTKELRACITTLTEQLLKTDTNNETSLSSSVSSLPLVIILDNLHHVPSFIDILNSFLSIHNARSPFVIGTMNQSNSMTSQNLKLHHNFRWILCTNHMEPVKGFLGRFLRRRLLNLQIETKESNDHLYHIIEWISVVWHHINKYLEIYNSADITIGPRLFLNCPMNVEKSKTWFIDLWNFSLVPYVLDAVKDGLNTYGRNQTTWDDPTEWIIKSWPWCDSYNSSSINNNIDTSNLIRLRAEDVGFESYQLITNISAQVGQYSVSAQSKVQSSNFKYGLYDTLSNKHSRITFK